LSCRPRACSKGGLLLGWLHQACQCRQGQGLQVPRALRLQLLNLLRTRRKVVVLVMAVVVV
jgi:hypothetical protein